jgi:hypothetical protein
MTRRSSFGGRMRCKCRGTIPRPYGIGVPERRTVPEIRRPCRRKSARFSRRSRYAVTVSHDRKWLAVIYSAGGDAHVEVFAIDPYGDLTPVATSSSVGVTAFNGVAISQ